MTKKIARGGRAAGRKTRTTTTQATNPLAGLRSDGDPVPAAGYVAAVAMIDRCNKRRVEVGLPAWTAKEKELAVSMYLMGRHDERASRRKPEVNDGDED